MPFVSSSHPFTVAVDNKDVLRAGQVMASMVAKYGRDINKEQLESYLALIGVCGACRFQRWNVEVRVQRWLWSWSVCSTVRISIE